MPPRHVLHRRGSPIVATYPSAADWIIWMLSTLVPASRLQWRPSVESHDGCAWIGSQARYPSDDTLTVMLSDKRAGPIEVEARELLQLRPRTQFRPSLLSAVIAC